MNVTKNMEQILGQKLRIAIVGAGNIGSTFAFQLANSGHHKVTVVARPGSIRLKQLQRDNGIININLERAQVDVVDSLDPEVDFDLVIVTTLAYQVDAVLPALAASKAKWIQFMFNCFEPERLSAAVGPERCSFGEPFVQALIDADGKLKSTIGAMGQKTKMGDQRLVDVFNASKLPATYEPNMALWLRCHAPLCVAFESISVAGVRRGGGASWAVAMTVARGAQEGWKLIQAEGDFIYPKAKARFASSPAAVLASVLWFMSRIKSFRELLANGLNECSALVDVMIIAAKRHPNIDAIKIQAMKP